MPQTDRLSKKRSLGGVGEPAFGGTQGLALQGPAAVLEARAAESEVPPRHCSDAQELVADGCPGNFEAQAENATGGDASQPAAQPRAQGLKVQAGAALSSYDAQRWLLCFTEFSYGDCAPSLERPSPLTLKQVFSYLMLREELEYSLQGDTEP